MYNYTGNGDTFNIHYVGGDPYLDTAGYDAAGSWPGIICCFVKDHRLRSEC